MESVKEWTVDSLKQEISQERDEFRSRQRQRLLDAHNSFVRVVESVIKDRVRAAITRGNTTVFIVNPQDGADLQGYSWMTIQRGFFNRYTRTYSRDRHIEAGIEIDPLSVLKARLQPKGIKSVEDLSDPKKGFGFLIKVEW